MLLKNIYGFFITLLLIPFTALPQINDDFTDGDFSLLPVWNGNSSQFIVNNTKQLQLNSTGADTAYLSTPNTLIDSTEWNCWVKLSFAPSDNNYVKIYLVSDQNDLTLPLNGYFVRMGEDGSFDSVDLWEQSGTTETKLIDGINGHCAKSTNTLRIKVVRDNYGNWKLFSDTLGGVNYVLEGTASDLKHTSSLAFGLSCKHTSSNATKFYFDDFYVGVVRVDTIAPAINNVYVVSPSALDVYFNEPVEQMSAELFGNYTVDNTIGNPISALRNTTNFNLVHLVFANTFQASVSYSLTINGVSDLQTNSITTSVVRFVLTERANSGDIVINEILSDPNQGGVDFVELYNNSNKIIDLSTYTLCSFDTITNQLSSVQAIAGGLTLFYPGQYVLLSLNSVAVQNQYYTTNLSGFIEMKAFPSMNIASGIIVLADTSQIIIDRFDYQQNMHFPLLNSTKGVSLERISPNRPASDRNNWHSASSTVGYATPAYKNSQTFDSKPGKEITFSNELFSPDNDGFNDVLNINYEFDMAGYVCSVSIYSSNGVLVRNIASNEMLSVSGTYTWDGINNDRELCPVGMYIVYFQLFNSSGIVKNYKKVAVLAHK
ncbi:MAG: lamin tail domain-containing protein [Bacteroidia bacterium]|nr:lamin tail domain-containing protein [Bacteroidia bacterium]